jgi:hypothetical protein
MGADGLKGQIKRWTPAIGSKGQSGGPWRGPDDHVADSHRGKTAANKGDVTANKASRGDRRAGTPERWGVPHSTHNAESAISHPKRAREDRVGGKR